jgi:hypothetical protein
MQLFDIAEAQHYCRGFTAEPGAAGTSIEAFRNSALPTGIVLREDTALFSQFRSCSLREVDRNLFLAASHYRRCLDSMIPSASHWAHVTMYYGSWFAARAILGLFGVTIFKRYIADVRVGTPRQQQLILRRIGSAPGQESSTYGGPHERFWDLFYRAVTQLRPLVDPQHAAFLTPILGDPAWLASQRNDVNYNSHAALVSAASFQASFSAGTFPTSLAGPLATQYLVQEGLLEIAFTYARMFSLATDATSVLSPPGGRAHKISKLVYSQRAPSLVSKTKKRVVTS